MAAPQDADPSALLWGLSFPGCASYSLACIFLGPGESPFVPSHIVWLISGYFEPTLSRVVYMNHNTHFLETTCCFTGASCINSQSQTKTLPSWGWICPGLSWAYFKTIICMWLYSDDNIGVCDFVPLLLSGGRCVSNAECEINICLKSFRTNVAGGLSHFLVAPYPSLLPFSFSPCAF